MDRRLALAALASWSSARLFAAEDATRPRHKISAGALHEALSARFPQRAGIAGLLDVRVSAPALLLMPARNLLGATLAAEVSGAQLPRSGSGELDVAFALRYEPSDRTVRAHQPEIVALRWPGLPPEGEQTMRRVLRGMTQQIGELVLHRLSERDLALPDTMGLEPDELRVVEDGVLVFFRPKAAARP